MGFFSKRRKTRHSADTRIARAVLTPAVSIMVADGEVADSELYQLQNLCAFSPIFFQLEPKDVQALMVSIFEEIKTSGQSNAIQNASATLSQPLRETALCFAARIAFADGYIDDGEKASFLEIAKHLDIPDATFVKILDVIAMLQRPATA